MSDAALLERIDKMASAMQLMATMLGTRLDRGQLAERMGVHRAPGHPGHPVQNHVCGWGEPVGGWSRNATFLIATNA